MPIYTPLGKSALTDVKEFEVQVNGVQEEHGGYGNFHFGEHAGAKHFIVKTDVFIYSAPDTGALRSEYEPTSQEITSDDVDVTQLAQAEQFLPPPFSDFGLRLDFSTRIGQQVSEQQITDDATVTALPTTFQVTPSGAINLVALPTQVPSVTNTPEQHTSTAAQESAVQTATKSSSTPISKVSPTATTVDTDSSGTTTNTAAEISGDKTATILEDTATVSGKLSISDPDAGESNFSAGTVSGSYGNLTISANGAWTYALNNASQSVQSLQAGRVITDTVTVTSVDGTQEAITITITGTNDLPVITGATQNTISEITTSVSGKVTATDIDTGENGFVAESVIGQYGTLSINAAGNYSYVLNSANSAVSSLGAGDSLTDTIIVTTIDGTDQEITITITGTSDSPIITGDTTNTILEDTVSVSGTLNITDPDVGESSFVTETITGVYGTLEINADGSYTYTLNNGAVQSLGAGDTATDTITVTSADGTEQAITITINGTNDAGVISGTATGAVTEDSSLSASGTLSVADVDSGESSFTAETISGTYGSLEIDNDGAWTYTLDNSAVQSLGAGDTATDTITVTSVDGTEQAITITINGTNDVAVISGTATGAVTEDSSLTASGTLSVTDADSDESSFTAETISGTYGSLAIDANGAWTYTLDNSAVQSLGAGDTATDTITVTSEDGTEQTITITINGTNDAAVLSGTATGAVTEDSSLTASGTLSVSDADSDESSFTAETVSGTYGALEIDADGAWTYTVDNSAVQSLGAGDTATDTITVTSADGTEQAITITINGTNDAAVISGTATGAVTEDTSLTASGTLSVSDADSGESSFTAETVSGTYGSLEIDNDGAWTYTLDNSAVQTLGAGDTATDTITVTSADGTEQAITITINGTNDAAVISGTATGAVTEDSSLTASGTFSVTDADTGEASFTAETISGIYGSLDIDTDGAWTYTLDNSAVQSLGAGDTATDTITVTSADGTEQAITITINGTNDSAVISGIATGTVTEDSSLTASGTLSVTDADSGEASFTAETISGTYGALDIDADGAWTYTLDNSAVQALGAGDTATDTITVTSADGTEQAITVTINGTNDAAVISGTATGAVTEDTSLTASGTLSVSDADTGEASFTAETLSGTYGALEIDADGAWTYTLDNSAVQSLGAGDTATDTITVTSADGTEQAISITINGTNDSAVISGTATGAVTEDSSLTASGTLSVSDADSGEASFTAETISGTYGALEIDADGAWIYTLDNSAVQSLGAGDTATDTITVTSADGTEQAITITINGTNDSAVISGTATGTVTEDSSLTASGTLSVTDADSGESSFTAETVSGTYGSLDIDADGAWTYTLDNSAVQSLGAGDTATDTITVTSADGTEQAITITINGTNDAGVISGTATGAVTEDTSLTASGTLSVSDADSGENSFTAETVSGTYGALEIDADGAWTYTLDNSAVQSLGAGDTATDTITVTSADGTEQAITITINGTNDAAVISGTATGAVTEDTSLTASGTLSVSDADSDESSFTAETISGTYGSLDIDADGAWTYTLDNSAVQSLGAGDTATDTITVTSADGTEQAITITINGTNDSAVISGTATGAVTEDSSLTASGTLSVTDADSGESSFTAETISGTYGSLDIDAGGAWTYTLDNSAVQSLGAGDTTTDTITVTSADGTEQAITITITGTNDTPTISGDVTATIAEDASTVTGTVTASDTDSGESSFAAETVSGTYGALVISSDGNYTYTLNNALSAVQSLAVSDSLTDTITVTTADGTTQDITITITGTNDGPVANADTATTSEDNSITIDVLANDTDIDNGDTQTITAASIEGSNNGSVSIVDGELVFDPGSDFDSLNNGESETVTINYTIQDSQGATSSSTVTVTVTGTTDNTAPIAVADTASTSENSTITIDVLANDSDADDDDLSITMATVVGDDNGAVSIVNNELVFNPGTDFDSLALGQSRDITINYTISDGTSTAMSTVTVTVSGTNDAPVAVADTASTYEDKTLTFDVLANDTDIDSGDTLSLISASIAGSGDDGDDDDGDNSDHGTVSIVDGKIVFDPGDDFDDLGDGESSTVVVNYTIQDASGETSDGTLTITVMGEDEGLVIDGTKNNDTLTGTDYDDTINAGKGDDVVYGGAGDDIIDGDKGDDVIYGGAGDDIIDAGQDDDVVEGGEGADSIDGGKGTDTASYASSSEGVTVNLETGLGSGGDAEGDTLTNIENIIGSSHDDVFFGDSEDNVITGGLGSDTYHFASGGGDDTFIGGGGAWTDVINLNNINSLPGEGDWTLQISNGATYNIDADTNTLEFDGSANGTITIGGDTLSFEDVEKITWNP